MRIIHLKLRTKNLNKQIEFYSVALNFEILKKTSNSVSFQIGKSILTFEESPEFHPYHFAINIPSNKENEALNYIKERTAVLTHEKAEIIDYPNWNAKALYFYDADLNIVEFISRYNLNYQSSKGFDRDSMIEISEIGLPTDNIESVFNELHSKCGLEIYDGNFERFCAIGDETGLIICINNNLKNWFPTNDKAYASDFEMTVLNEEIKYLLKYKNGILSSKIF